LSIFKLDRNKNSLRDLLALLWRRSIYRAEASSEGGRPSP
jgi:hypothetical protein